VLLRWLAGVHDIGKVSPVFAVQVPRLADLMRQQGLAMPGSFSDRKILRHELAGQLILRRWLAEKYGWHPVRSGPVAVVVGGPPRRRRPTSSSAANAKLASPDTNTTPPSAFSTRPAIGPIGVASAGSGNTCWLTRPTMPPPEPIEMTS
jgi:hypothetical protein